MKKLLSVLIVLMVIMTFVSCDNDTSKVAPSNAGIVEDENTILIESVEDYMAFVNDVNSGNLRTEGKLVKLTNDIEFSEITDEFIPLNFFEGTFDGGNFTLRYSYSDETFEGNFGLFKATSGNVTIKNLKLDVSIDVTVKDSGDAITISALVGKNDCDSLTISNVRIYGSIAVLAIDEESVEVNIFVGSGAEALLSDNSTESVDINVAVDK